MIEVNEINGEGQLNDDSLREEKIVKMLVKNANIGCGRTPTLASPPLLA